MRARNGFTYGTALLLILIRVVINWVMSKSFGLRDSGRWPRGARSEQGVGSRCNSFGVADPEPDRRRL